jgi:hypothetical protein
LGRHEIWPVKKWLPWLVVVLTARGSAALSGLP